MRKGLFLLLVMSSSTVMAQPVFIDVAAATTQAPGNAGSAADVDTYTSIFDALQLFADTTTVQYDTNLGGTPGLNPGDKFIDAGTATITSLLPPLGDGEGLGLLSEITVAWNNLTGEATSELTPIGIAGDVVQTFAYDHVNTTFEFFFHGDATGPNGDFGSNVGVADNTGFTDGEKVLELSLKGGSGTNTFDAGGNFLSGSSILNGEITFALNDFWWFDNGDGTPGTAGDDDFNDLLGLAVPIVLRSTVDQNTDDVETDFSNAGTPGPGGVGNELFAVNSTHDGSINFAVPAPKTLLLLGLGLVLFPLFRRRFF